MRFLTVFSVLMLCTIPVFRADDDTEDYTKQLRSLEQDIAHFFGKHKQSPIEIMKLKAFFATLKLDDDDLRVGFRDYTACGLCKLLVWKVQLKILPVETLAKFICNMYISFRTLSVTQFCDELLALHIPTLKYILYNSDILSPDLVCSVILQKKACYKDLEELTWQVSIPQKPSNLTSIELEPDNGKTLKLLHLSDFHISPDYEEGSRADCGYPVCCLKGLGSPLKGHKAGKWGDYLDCDIPKDTYLTTLDHIKATHKDIDLIYFTGDIIDHAIWRTTKTKNSDLITFTFDKIQEIFPDTKFYPVIGNHEATPLDVYPPPDIVQEEFSQQWLYDLVKKLWAKWLPESALETVGKQGYYTHVFNDKLRIIGLNNNVCYKFNWWLLYDTNYLNEQLEWLRNILLEAEEKGEFVHIIAHVPPGNKECVEPWEKSYNALVYRFSHIIKGQFFGHTHTDDLKVFYNETDKEPMNVGYNGASLTPFEKYNPNYKIYTLNSSTYEVIEADTYIFNLTDANLHKDASPRWYKLYSLKQAFGLQDLSPQSLSELALKFFKDDDLLYQYFRYNARDGDASLEEGCDSECRQKLTCQVVTTNSMNPTMDCDY